MVFSLHPCSQPQRGVAADLPGEGRRRPGALQAGAQPGRQQPRLPLTAVSAPDTHVEVRRRRRSRSPRKHPRLGARMRFYFRVNLRRFDCCDSQTIFDFFPLLFLILSALIKKK